jgi:RNA polymerase subunit RPABC4/transcription elongation factor Spt4
MGIEQLIMIVAAGAMEAFDFGKKKIAEYNHRSEAFCRHCGTHWDEADKFCKKCGQKEHATNGEIEDALTFGDEQLEREKKAILSSIKTIQDTVNMWQAARTRYNELAADSVSICNACSLFFETEHKFCTQCGKPTERPTETVIRSMFTKAYPNIIMPDDHTDIGLCAKNSEDDALLDKAKLEADLATLNTLRYPDKCPSNHALILRDGVLMCDICDWKAVPVTSTG